MGTENKHQPVILHLVTWYPSSDTDVSGIFTRRQIELLSENNQYRHVIVKRSITPFSIIDQVKSLFGLFVKIQVGKMQVIMLPDEKALNRPFFWRFKNWFEQKQMDVLIRYFKPALLHLHVVYGFANEAMELKKKRGTPFVVSEHMAPFPFEWIHNKDAYIIKPMQQAAAVVAVSTAQAKQINEVTGVKPVIIHNVVKPGEFYFDEKKKEETSIGLQLVLVGIYDSRKGADYLLSTLPSFLQTHPNTMLHLVGEASTERMASLRAIIAAEGIEEAVCFHGKLSATSLCKLYHQCDFYVCSSEWESFGVSVLESLFAGVPVLATDCGGVSEFMNTNNGIIIENDRKKTTLLMGLLKMADRLNEFNRKHISAEAIEQFAGERIKEQYFSLYQKVIAVNQQAGN